MLIAELDGYLDPLYPKESQHGYRAKKLVEQKVEFYVIYYEGEPAACGGVQFIGNPDDPAESFGELKRMYVRDQFRGLGLAKQMLAHLERVAASMGAARMRLETGIHQPKAIGLYEKCGYFRIPPFGNYPPGDPLSLCYEKRLDYPYRMRTGLDNAELLVDVQQPPPEPAQEAER